ncbi:MAG TPA: hypothetical protein VNV15_02475 [Opitutaceae bacterium]|nr:hypothetical protein [Opitutaceae bacterium]
MKKRDGCGLIIPSNRPVWLWAATAGVIVLAAQWWLVARAGTDIPFRDQWDVEGLWLYPAWRDGTLRLSALFQAHNEHRLVWTYLLDLSLFALNGQWDPLLQMAAGAGLHALAVGFLVRELVRGSTNWKVQGGLAAGVALAGLPLAAWFNALCGIQSNTYFALIFSFVAFAWLGAEERSRVKLIGGMSAGLAAMFSLGAGELVPVALLGLAVLHATERRRLAGAWRSIWPALVLLAVAVVLIKSVPANKVLESWHAGSLKEFTVGFMRAAAWPHTDQPLAALALNLPLALVVMGRMARRRQPRTGEDFVLLLGGWAVANALAMAWARGGAPEFQAGIVPSRYVDFLVLLPLANAWCAIVLAAEALGPWRLRARVLAAVWWAFLFLGWLGVSLEAWRGIVQPRMEDRLAPVRVMVAFQASGDGRVFIGQPQLNVPHFNMPLMLAVLHDPRLQGALPPSLQPKLPMGPLSREVRMLMGQEMHRRANHSGADPKMTGF